MRQGDGDIPYLKVYNLTFDGNVDFTNNPTFIPRAIHEGPLRRSRVYPGDLLMNIVGPPLGKIGIVSSDYHEWNINQAIAVLRPIEGINVDFLMLWLLSPQLLSHLVRRAKATAGQYNLTLEICRELPIPTPAPDEQIEIVRRVSQLLEVASNLKLRALLAGACLDRGAEAVLTKVFRGELPVQASLETRK
jgi:type I restriction enzyme S subunit